MPTTTTTTRLQGAELEAWRSYLKSQRSILRELDADLVAGHGLTARDYEVLLFLAQAPGYRLAMSGLAESTMLTRSGVTRLIDGLVRSGLIERVSCAKDARISYAQLTDAGMAKLREAGRTHIAGIRRLFLAHYTDEEIEQLAHLLGRLPGGPLAGSCSADPAADSCSADPAADSCSVDPAADSCSVE